MKKLVFIEHEENRKKIDELCDKIIPLFNGYTFNQIQDALNNAKEILKEEYVINLSD